MLVISTRAQAQQTLNYPVTTQAYFMAPFSQRLADYFASDKRLLIDLLLKDLTKSSIQVYLQWSIEGTGIRVQSREGFVPQQFITLQRGITTRLRGTDLQAAYFTPQAIQTQGFDPASIYTIELPEGFYTLKVQALEAATGQVVSNLSETYMVLAYPQPPILNLPITASEVPVTSMQKVPIAWAPRHFATPTTQAVYTLKVCAVPEGYEPNEQIMLTCTEPRLDITLPATATAPDITQWIKPLEVGARYAVQVTVSDLSGELTNFVNQGRSQVSWFRYGKECTPPVFTIQSLGTDRIQLSWERVEGAQSYVVEYKLATAADWQTLTSSSTSQVVSGLKPRADYLFRMRTDCGGAQPSAASEIQSWNIRDEAPAAPPVLPQALSNPLAIGVQASGTGVAQQPTSLSALYANYPRPVGSPGVDSSGSPRLAADSTLLKLPYCAASASSFAGCEQPHPTVALPGSAKELSSLRVGDVLGIYDYAVFVTKVGGGSPLSGEGLARLPFLGGTMALVEFSGVKAKAGEEGTHGGCVYEVPEPGYFRIKRASQAQVQAAQQALISQLLARQDSLRGLGGDSSQVAPRTFRGTLGQALSQYDSLVSGLPSSSTVSLPVATRQGLMQYSSAIAQGTKALQASFEEVYEGSRDGAVVAIRDSLASLLATVETSLSGLQGDTVGTRVALKLPLLVARYGALFDQLTQLTSPATSGNSLNTTTLSPVVLSNLTDSGVKLSWSGDPAISRYVVHYQLEGAGELQQAVSGSSLQLLNLKPGSNYTYTIEAYQGDQLVSSYAGTPFTTLLKTIPPPQNLVYSVVDDRTVKLSWDKNTQHLSYKLVYTDESGQQRTVYPSSNGFTLQGLAANQAYPYEVIAYGSDKLVSDVATSNFQLGSVCYANIAASADRVVEGTEVTLTVSSCRDKDGNPGMVTWTGKGLPQTFGTTQVFRPSETASYTSSCRLMVDKGNGAEPVTCSDTRTIIVDKACTGVVATVTPNTIDVGQAVILQSTGCAGGAQWGMGYPVNEGLVSTQKSAIIYPPLPQNVAKTYTLSCTDQTGTPCLVQAGTVYTKCAFKLGVSTQSSGSPFLSKLDKQIIVEATGCSGDISWERDGGNVNIKINQVDEQVPKNKIVYSNIRKGFTVNATCSSTGCKATTGYLEAPSTSTLCDRYNRFFIQQLSSDGKSLQLGVMSAHPGSVDVKPTLADLSFTWDDDGSTTNPRTIPLPKVPSIFSVSTEIGGCKAAFAYQPPITPSSSNALPPIPCIEFTVKTPVPATIPWNGDTAKDVVLQATGCAVSDKAGTITWTVHNQPDQIIASDDTGILKRSFTQEGPYYFDAKCELTGQKKTIRVDVSKGTKPPVTFKVTPKASGQIPAGGGPVDILLQSSGCTDADPAIPDGTVTWRDPNKAQVAAVPGKIGNTRIALIQPGTYIYTATCSITKETLPVEVKVTQQANTLPDDPCNFYVIAPLSNSAYYNVWLRNEPVKLDINGAYQLSAQVDDVQPFGFIANVAYPISSNQLVVTHSGQTSGMDGTFWLTITNKTKEGATCTTRVFITVNQDKWVYLKNFNDVPVLSQYTPKSNGTAKQLNCANYRNPSTTINPYIASVPVSTAAMLLDRDSEFGAFLQPKSNDLYTVGLVDKVCMANNGTAQWFLSPDRKIQAGATGTEGNVPYVFIENTRAATYYGRCTVNGYYCDTQVTIDNSKIITPPAKLGSGSGRVAASDQQQTGDTPCVYSTQAAVQTLLINVLCRKLAAVPNPGNEQAQLEAIKATLQQQGIALADITDKMVADLATGYCNKVVAALTNLPKGADDVQPVADLDKIINNDLVNQLVSDALSNELTQCPIETPPALQQEMALAGGRIAAYTIDPNRLFIAPDGRAVKLPDGATPKFFNFSGSWGTPPAGTLQGFVLADGSLYFAHIINSPQKFEGYALVKSPFCPAIYKEDIYVTTAATTPTAVYYFDFYSSNDQCGYRWNEGAYTLKPTADHSLIDIQPVVLGPTTNATVLPCRSSEWVRGADGVSRRRFTLDGNTFDLEDRGGNITVKGHWQDFGKCGECPAKAEVALQAALAKVSGKLTEQTEIIPATTQSYGPAGAIVYQPMKLMDLLQNLSKTYNSLLDKAKVPEALWKPQDELSPEDKNFFVRDGTGVISGALDQTIEEVTDLPQLVGLGLSVVSDPQGAYDQLSTFAQNMSWQKAKDFATEAAKSTIQFDNLTSPKSEYQRYGTGRIGVTVVKLATTGGAATFLLLVKKTPDLLALWTRLIKKMQDLNWSDADIARFKYDFQTTEDILKRFDADEFDFDASKAFDENKILRRNADNLTALTNIKSLLPADGSMTMDDIKAALTKSDSKQSTLTDLEGYLKNGNLDEARKLVDKGVSYASALPKPLPYTEIGLIHNTAIDNFVTQRQAARQAIQDLTSTGDAYKTARQAKISEIIGYSEQIAESVADASFIKDGFERVDELLAEALPGSGKSGKFDRLYRNPQTGEWKVVECKGGTSQPGGRRRKADGTNNEQGTEDYIRSIIEDLTAPGSTITASQRDLLGQLQSAIDGGKAQSYLLRQPFDDATGELKQARLSTIF